ncbi:MAG: glycosyltransferase family 4 protein [Candidatus Nanopelagicales bacterium]
MSTSARSGGLGLAANWDPVPERTWSGSAWALYQALDTITGCQDVGLHLPLAARRGLQLASRRRRAGQWVSNWEHATAWQACLQAAIRRRVRQADCRKVVTIQDIVTLDVPFYIYQDISYDLLLAERERDPSGVKAYFRTLDDRTLRRRRERQLRVYEQAAGVIAMSRWLAGSLVRDTGLDPARVHIAQPGATSLATVTGSARLRPAPRTRLLFLGTGFLVKGGDIVLAAMPEIRATNPGVTLTVAGPRVWPLATPPPAGVRFIGEVARRDVGPLLDAHDLLVMPSRLEGFGIVFAEALARGLPCVGRDAFAIPEIITAATDGALVGSDDPAELAATVVSTLADDRIYEAAAQRAGQQAARYTWANTARQVLRAVAEA